MPSEILEENILPTRQSSYFIRPLENTLEDLAASHALQAKIMKGLNGEPCAIKVQSIASFSQNRNRIHGVTLGVFIRYPNETHPLLIAQGTLSLPPYAKAPRNDEITIEPDKIGVLEHFMTDPGYRGNALMDKLAEHLQNIGRADFGLETFGAVVDAAKEHIYNSLLRRGYVVVKAYTDAADKCAKYGFMQMEKCEKTVRIPAAVDEINEASFKHIQMLLDPQIAPTLLPFGCVRPLRVLLSKPVSSHIGQKTLVECCKHQAAELTRQ